MMQHTCHWYCRSKSVASARMLASHRTSYEQLAFRRNAGFRMDFLLISPQLLPRVTGDGVDREYRGREKPSDHAPVWIELAWP